MIKWRRIEDHPDTETRYCLDTERKWECKGTQMVLLRERKVIPPGRWLFRWEDGSISSYSTDEALSPLVWPGRMVERPTHWAEFNEPEVSLCRHDLDISYAGIYCRKCGEEFEDNTGSNEMGG